MQTALSFSLTKEPPRPIYCLFLTFFLFLLLLFLLSSPSPSPPLPSFPLPSSSSPSLPSFSYLLTGSNNDGDKLLRLLLSLYHPNNVYLLHLDKSAGRSQRERLAREVRAIPVIKSVKNAHVVGEPGFANQRGASALAATLHGAAILLRICAKWDWFITLDASDYPLVTQDDILHVFSNLPKDLNFVQHTSYIGWKESRRIRPIIVDPGLYLSSRTDVFYATQKRDLPSAYRLFTGSPSVILSRKFIEYTILGTENLPRNLLMYYSNTPSPHLNYFQTLLCNSPDFNSTIVNHNLHFTTENSTILDFSNLTQTDAIFASLKGDNNRILGRIDEEILGRERRRIVPGGWCLGASQTGRVDPCSVWGSPDLVRPGPRAGRIAGLIAELVVPEKLYNSLCIWD